MAGGALLTERRGSIEWVTLNRPEARNALTWSMYDALLDVCERVNLDRSVGAVVITGADGTFAAGTDITQFREFRTLEQALDYERHASHVLETLEAVRAPVVAALAGACTGGGAAIAMCCDIRIAAPTLRFGIPIARTLGNCLSHQSYARLVAVLGLPRAKELLMTGRLVGAQELLAAGFVSDVVEEPALAERAQKLAEALAANAPLTLAVTKRALHRVRNRLFPVEDDADIIATCYLSEDFREGVDAFIEKRRPQWRGR